MKVEVQVFYLISLIPSATMRRHLVGVKTHDMSMKGVVKIFPFALLPLD